MWEKFFLISFIFMQEKRAYKVTNKSSSITHFSAVIPFIKNIPNSHSHDAFNCAAPLSKASLEVVHLFIGEGENECTEAIFSLCDLLSRITWTSTVFWWCSLAVSLNTVDYMSKLFSCMFISWSVSDTKVSGVRVAAVTGGAAESHRSWSPICDLWPQSGHTHGRLRPPTTSVLNDSVSLHVHARVCAAPKERKVGMKGSHHRPGHRARQTPSITWHHGHTCHTHTDTHTLTN